MMSKADAAKSAKALESHGITISQPSDKLQQELRPPVSSCSRIGPGPADQAKELVTRYRERQAQQSQ